MGPERDDYADRDLPPTRWTAERVVVTALRVVAIGLVLILFALLYGAITRL